MPRWYKAIGAYTGQEDGELSFPADAVLEMLESDDQSGFHKMRFEGVVGRVHMAYVEPTMSAPVSAPPVPPRRASFFQRMRSGEEETDSRSASASPTKGKAVKGDKSEAAKALAAQVGSSQYGNSPSPSPAAVSLTRETLQSGVFYHVQFLGTMEIDKQLREFSSADRQAILLESINVIAERTGLKPAEKMPDTRDVPAPIKEALGLCYVVRKKGCTGGYNDVDILVSLDTIKLCIHGSPKRVLEEFPILDVALLSAGSNFFPHCAAVVVRQPKGRVCHVFDCGKYDSAVLMALAEALRLKHDKSVQMTGEYFKFIYA